MRDDGVGAWQMFQVVADKDDIEGAAREGRAQCQTVRLHELHVRSEGGRDITDIGRPAFSGSDVSDEIAQVARDVEDSGVCGHPALQIAGDLDPEPILRPRVGVAEAPVVDPIEPGPGAHGRPASNPRTSPGAVGSGVLRFASRPRTKMARGASSTTKLAQ